MKRFRIAFPRFISEAIEKLERAGYEAYAVGGCVRDAILGKIPNDWDITTSAKPDETAAVFADYRTIETGVKHGTLTVLMDGIPLEITTFRSDGVYLDHRHPKEVRFSDSLSEDLKRRDFTVNAMAYNERIGLVDLFGGQSDLENHVIRTVGDANARLEEDGLRILRGLRFASVLGFEIDADTARAIHEKRELLKAISAERIREEFCKLICGRNAVPILREYADVFGVFLPELTACMGVDQNTKYHCYDVFEHLLHALEANDGKDLTLRLAILFHDVGKPETYSEDELGGHFYGHGEKSAELCEKILQRLRFDRRTAEDTLALVSMHDRVPTADKKSVKRLMAKMSEENILRLLEVKRCDRMAHAPDYRTLSSDLFEIPRVIEEIKAENACFSLRNLAVNGKDLQSIGIRPGKELGAILESLLEQVIDEKLPNERERLLEQAKKEVH